ncbi:MAG: COX15/CtaA family protein, partial [Frankia sp.]|nr:COX15/CtaA family protein [Frankia sp.]
MLVSRFAKLATATALATLVMVGIGGLVRATGSGLACGAEWPRCHGRLVPPSTAPSWIEHSHRLWALVVIALVIALAVEARRSAQPRTARLAAYALVPVVLSQALLGAVVVWLRLQPISVAAHLAIALSILAVAAVLARRSVATRDASGVGRRAEWLAKVTAGATLGQLLLGSLVTGAGAGLAYTSFPSFDGSVVPQPHGVSQLLHVAHRGGAVVVAVLVCTLAWRLRDAPPRVRQATRAAVALVAGQVALGATVVLSRLAA